MYALVLKNAISASGQRDRMLFLTEISVSLLHVHIFNRVATRLAIAPKIVALM